MTTKAEFDKFIAGFKIGLAGHDNISIEQLDEILAMVPDVISAEVGAATAPTPVAAPAPLEIDPTAHPSDTPVSVAQPVVIDPATVPQPAEDADHL
jgi:hypothetical protein